MAFDPSSRLRERIERLVADPYLELFAREKAPEVGIAGEIKPACSMPERFKPVASVAACRFPAVAFVPATHTYLPLNLIEIKVGSPNLCIDFENDHTRQSTWRAAPCSAISQTTIDAMSGKRWSRARSAACWWPASSAQSCGCSELPVILGCNQCRSPCNRLNKPISERESEQSLYLKDGTRPARAESRSIPGARPPLPANS
jgi:hypothetical protein